MSSVLLLDDYVARYSKERTWVEQKKYRLNCVFCGNFFYASKPFAKTCSTSHRVMLLRKRRKGN